MKVIDSAIQGQMHLSREQREQLRQVLVRQHEAVSLVPPQFLMYCDLRARSLPTSSSFQFRLRISTSSTSKSTSC